MLAVVALLVAGVISAAREQARRADQPPSPISPVTDVLPSLAQQPGLRWPFPSVPGGDYVLGPAGGDEHRVLYAVKDGPGLGDQRLAVLRAGTGERTTTIPLGRTGPGVSCLVNDAHAVCASSGPQPEFLFLDLERGTVVRRLPGTVNAVGYRVGDGFLIWSETAPPTRYDPDGTVRWQAKGSSFVASPAAPVVYELDTAPGRDGEGRVRAADDGRELVTIAVKRGQRVAFQAYPGGFALERPGQAIRFFDAAGEAQPGAVSAEGGQRLAPQSADDSVVAGLGPAPAAAPIPVILEDRDDDVTVVGVDPAQQRNLWKRTVPQQDAAKVRVWGLGRKVLVDDGDGHCFAFGAATGAGGAIPCNPMLGTDGERLVGLGRNVSGAPDTSAVVAYLPGEPQRQLWRVPLDRPEALGPGLYGVEGRLD